MTTLDKVRKDLEDRISELRADLGPKTAELARLEAALKALKAARRGRPQGSQVRE